VTAVKDEKSEVVKGESRPDVRPLKSVRADLPVYQLPYFHLAFLQLGEKFPMQLTQLSY
jgi:hypothetical protein